MKHAYIFHGIGGHSQENWFPWLKTELENNGWKVFVPNFPNASEPQLDLWLKFFEDKHPNNKQTGHEIFIGHSLGVSFLLRLLERGYKTDAAYCIASAVGPLDNSFDKRMKTLTHPPYSWNKIKDNCKYFEIFHSDNDQYVPLQRAEWLAEHLNTRVKLIKNGGHINGSAGYREFPELKKAITLQYESHDHGTHPSMLK